MFLKLFSHTTIYGIAPQIGLLAGIFALPIITKDLTLEDYGIWGVLLAYVGLFKGVANLGFSVVISNSFYKHPERHRVKWRQYYGFLHMYMVGYSLVLAAVLWAILPESAIANRQRILLALILPDLIFGPTTLLGSYYYQLRQSPVPIAIRSGIFGITTVALNIYFISGLKLGYMGWLWSSMIVKTAMHVSYWVPLNFHFGYRPIYFFKWRTIRKAIKVGLPTVPHQYSSYLLHGSDRLVLDKLQIPIGEIGQYSLAARFGSYFQAFVSAANKAVSPMMLALYKKDNEVEARNLIFTLQTVVCTVTTVFCIWSREIFWLLINNEELAKVYPIAIVIVMSYNYRPMYIGAMMKVFYLEKTKLLWRVSFIAGLGNLLLNLIFVPVYGFQAAAFTTFACLMYMGFSGYLYPKIRELQQENYFPHVWFGLIIGLTVAAYISRDIDVAWKIVFTLIVSAFACVAIIKFQKSKKNAVVIESENGIKPNSTMETKE